MAPEELIPAGEFCTFHRVELSFLKSLHESGLIVMTVQDGGVFLNAGELSTVEKFARWHYDLAINTEGIEALAHMLGRFEGLIEENRRLRSRLLRYEQGTEGPVEPFI